LAVRIREFARTHDATVVASALLSAQLDADVRTIAAALRRHGVRPRNVAGTRSYAVADLRALVTFAEPPPPGSDHWSGLTEESVAVLSAGAGHDMSGALQAARTG
jgi:class 3 adenylate cyclase